MNQAIVAVIDNEQEVTDSLSWLIKSEGYQVDTYSSAEPFLGTLANSKQPSCIVADIRMPVISGFELQQILKSRGVNIPIIFITGHGDISMAVHAMQEGALHFLTKPINNQVLLETIHRAIRLDTSRRAREGYAAQFHSKLKHLTSREYEVMCLMVTGKLTKTIAYQLNISISTVELYRAKVKKKMEVASLAELVNLSAQYGLMPSAGSPPNKAQNHFAASESSTYR